MENKLNKIVTEAINNIAIFGELKNHSSDLQYYVNALKNSNNKTQFNGEILNFNNELIAFTEALINAINRCVQKQNINEEGSGWISNVPSLNKLYNSMVNGYKEDVLGSLISKKQQFKNIFGDNSFGYGSNNSSSLPKSDAKLQVILTQYFPLIQQKYKKLNIKYNNALENMNPPTAKYILNKVEEVLYTIRNV